MKVNEEKMQRKCQVNAERMHLQFECCDKILVVNTPSVCVQMNIAFSEYE